MRPALRTVLVLAAALGAAACGSTKPRPAGVPEDPAPELDHKIKGFQVIWTRGGKLGYLKTYDVSMAEDTPVEMHYVEDLDFRMLGWVANDGQGVRYEYPADRIREAKRAAFEQVELPIDTVENQIRRILGLDPQAPLALRRAEAADLERK